MGPKGQCAYRNYSFKDSVAKIWKFYYLESTPYYY